MEHCYRHPDRETRVSCSRCGRPICTDCMIPSPVGMHCPECAGERQVVKRPAFSGQSAGAAAMPLTIALIVINVVVFIAELGRETLIVDGGLVGPFVADGEWYRLITAGFLHDDRSPLHLAFNMLALYFIGRDLEIWLGWRRLLAVYFVALLGGSAGALLVDPNALTVGASGAIYGLFAVFYLVARDRGEAAIAQSLLVILAINLLFTFSVPNISVGGHLGGLVAGGLAAAVLIAARRAASRPPEIAELAALVLLAGLLFGAGLAVA